MKYAQVQNGVVLEVFRVNPSSIYPESYAGQFIEAPDDVDRRWLFDGETFTPPVVVVDFPKEQAAFVVKIDTDADAIYSRALGNRATEYAQAEADATAYKTAGYTGTVPPYVQAWATATGKTATWATDDILTTSTAWRTAMAAIRFNRLGRKEDARKAVDVAALEVVKAQWAGFVSAITTQLGV